MEWLFDELSSWRREDLLFWPNICRGPRNIFNISGTHERARELWRRTFFIWKTFVAPHTQIVYSGMVYEQRGTGRMDERTNGPLFLLFVYELFYSSASASLI